MPSDGLQVRVPRELMERADALVPALAEVAELRAWGPVTRNAVVRLALLRGLDVLAAEYGPQKATKVSADTASPFAELGAIPVEAWPRGTYRWRDG